MRRRRIKNEEMRFAFLGSADAFEFPRARLAMGKELGHGAFGVVCEAVATNIAVDLPAKLRVAVKQVILKII
jgi:hypothetical protein